MNNEYSIKITKLPRHKNENNIVYHEAYINSRVCPYCNNYDNAECYDYESWYGTEDKLPFWKIFFLGREKHMWRKLLFKCYNCGAEWESMPFRYDYPDDVIMRETN